jgi:hypothetical protein
MKLATIKFLQQLLTSDQLTLKGNQISSVAIVMQELQEEEKALLAAAPPVAGKKIASKTGK